MEQHFHGPITAISFLSHQVLVYAQGSRLVLYHILYQRILDARQLFPNGRRIFGVSNFVLHRDPKRRFVLVYGERLVSVSYLKSLEPVEWHNISLIHCSDWVFDVLPIEYSENESCFLILCAQSHHACEVFSVDFTNDTCHFAARLQFSFEEITWSASIYVDKITEIITIANGCYSGNIQLFQFPKSLLLASDLQHRLKDTRSSCQLKGHRGPIFRIRWDLNGTRLATTADDRCIQIWKKCTRNSFQQQVVLWDSTSRVWDLEFLPNDMIIAACEDGIVRIWNISDGKCLIRLEDSYGMNVFCSSSFIDDPFPSFIATGAADSNCQIYRLEDVLRRQIDRYSAVFELPLVKNTGLEYISSMDKNPKKPSAAQSKESIKSIRCLSRESLIIYTDHNRIYHIGLWKEEQEWKQRWTLLVDVKDKTLAPISMTLIEYGILIGTNCGQVLILSLLDIKRKLECHCEVDPCLRIHSFQATRKGAVMNIFSTWEDHSNRLVSPQVLKREQIFIVAPDGCMLWYYLVWNIQRDCLQDVQLLYILKHPSKDGLFTAMCYHSTTFSVICGDKKGKIFVFLTKQQQEEESHDSDVRELMPNQSLHLHNDRIHCLSWTTDNIFFSGSIDGMLFRNVFVQKKQYYQVETLCQRKCFYKVATVDKFLRDPFGHRLFLVGFHSKYLTIWDVLEEKEVVSIDCGGWRRAHDVWFCSNELLIVFSRRGQLFLRYECFEDRPTPRTISNGFHGMRINHIMLIECKGILQLISCGEDTMVRNSLFCTNSFSMYSRQILDCHISGVQCCAVDEDILWTGSGKDQLVIWQKVLVHSNVEQSAQISTLHDSYYQKKDVYFGTLDKTQRLRLVNKATKIATQRVTSLLVLPKYLLTRNKLHGVLLSLVFVTRSDGSFALHGLIDEENSPWTILSLCRFKASQFPILCSQCVILPQRLQKERSKILIFACNTVGQLIIWQVGEIDLQNLSSVLNDFEKDSIIISDLHKGAIHDLHVSLLENDDILVVTGGEDQRMRAHLFHLDNISMDEKPIIVKQHSFEPRYGHSASVTAVWTNGRITFSCGADQRLIMWKTFFDKSNIYLKPLKAIISNVSDISCISVVNNWLALAGYGVEFMKWKE